MQFALTGEQPGKVKESLVHWGAKDGKVTLEFEAEGKPGRIVRPILSPKVTLEYDGQEVTGITAVAKAMEERLNVDRDLVRQSVFVRQKEIDTVLSAKTDRREREVAFQKLIGIDAAKMHKNLTDWLYQAVKPLNYDIQITDAEKRVGEIEARIAELDGKVADADAKLKAAGSPDDTGSEHIRKSIATITELLDAQGKCHVTKEAELKAVADLQAAKNAVADCGENPSVDIATKAQENQVLSEEIAKGNEVIRATATRDNAKAAHERCEQALAAIDARPHPEDDEIRKLETDVAALQATLAAQNAEFSAHQKALGTLSGGETACPVCGKPLDGDTLARLRAELAVLQESVSDTTARLSDQRKQLSQLTASKSSWERDRALAVANLASSGATLEREEKALAGLPMPAVDVKTAQEVIVGNNEAIRLQKEFDERAAGRKAALQTAEIRLQVAEKAVKEAEAHLADSEASVGRLYGKEALEHPKEARASLEEVIAAAEKKRQEVQSLQVGLASATATRDEAVKTLETTRRTVSELRERQKEQDALARRLKVLENVRDWLHYANGPRFIVKQVLAALTDDVNRFLGNFTAPFVVHPNDEDLGFIVEFTDGRDRPEKPQTTEVLSGGELVQLAVAFRFSTYCMFAGKLGLLSLDEPMAFLDTNNIGRFGVFLSKVREITRNMNVQVFVATHQQVVIPHMDSVIDLN